METLLKITAFYISTLSLTKFAQSAKVKFAYIFLHHVRTTSPHHLHIILNEHRLVFLSTFQHGVNANVRTSSSNTGTGQKKKVKDSSFNNWTCHYVYLSLVAHQAVAYPGSSSMKCLGVFLLPPGWGASPSQGYSEQKIRRVPIYTPG